LYLSHTIEKPRKMSAIESLHITGTYSTPEIVFDTTALVFKITGKSMPEDAVDFYRPILDWVNEFTLKPIENAKFVIKLVYFNTASSKMILEIIKRIGKAGANITIDWYYDDDDEDMLEVGEHLQSILGKERVILKSIEE
jgi:hypothetical protein